MYTTDPFIIRQILQHIFLTPLAQQLRQHVGSLQCFLSTNELAVEGQAICYTCQGETARNVFLPMPLPTNIHPYRENDDSTYSSKTTSSTTSSPNAVTYVPNNSQNSTNQTECSSFCTSSCSPVVGKSLPLFKFKLMLPKA